MTKDSDASTSKSKGGKTQEAAEITDKLKILCLHGYRQNGNTFKSKIGAFRKVVGKYADFVFLTAPNVALPPMNGDPEQRSWWANKEDGSFKGTNKGGPAIGFEDALRSVETAWKMLGPFQGLLGFSQGACLVGLICGLSKKKLTSIKPEFAIMASGFNSGSLVHKSIYEEPISIPSLHIYGLTDEIIPCEMSKELCGFFKNAETIEHPGGHFFPAQAQQKQIYIRFFQDRLQEYLENLELRNAMELNIVEDQGEAASTIDTTHGPGSDSFIDP